MAFVTSPDGNANAGDPEDSMERHSRMIGIIEPHPPCREAGRHRPREDVDIPGVRSRQKGKKRYTSQPMTGVGCRGLLIQPPIATAAQAAGTPPH